MSTIEKNDIATCRTSDIDFKIFFDHNEKENEVIISGIYLIKNLEVDLIDVIGSNIIEDLEQDIEDNFDEQRSS